MEEILEYSPILITGTITTIQLTLASAVLALVVSFVVGLSRFSRLRTVRVAAIIYLEFFSGHISHCADVFYVFCAAFIWYYIPTTAGRHTGLWS